MYRFPDVIDASRADNRGRPPVGDAIPYLAVAFVILMVRRDDRAAVPDQRKFPQQQIGHGSTGRGHNKSFYTRTASPAVVANHFVERGWMILFPQRRGRGKSGGAYGEGLAPDGSGYSCNAEIAIAGFERAVEDMDAVVRHLRERPDVEQSRLVIAGVSRGGILSIAYAGMGVGLLSIVLLLLFQFLDNLVQFVEARVPELAIALDPCGNAGRFSRDSLHGDRRSDG